MNPTDASMCSALLEAMSEAVYMVDRDRTITYWNPAAERVTGFSAAEVVGRRCRDGILNHVDETGELLCGSRCPLLATMHDGRPREASVFLHHHGGHRVPVTISAAALRDPSGDVCGAVEVFRDETRLRQMADRLDAAEVAALTDPLTGLANRRFLQRALRRQQSEYRRYEQKFAVLFADIDTFKDINDRYGHEIGDEILQLVAATMRDCVRDSDTVGRWGGEEFLIIAPVIATRDAVVLADRVRNMVASAWIDLDDMKLAVTISVGVAIIEGREHTSALIDRADAAMFTAKVHGRNRTVVA